MGAWNQCCMRSAVSSLVEDAAAAATSLQDQAAGLAKVVSVFRLDAAGEAQRAPRPAARKPEDLASGPGKLTLAMGITRALNGASLAAPPFELLAPEDAVELVAGPRIGISKAMEVPWRFGLAGSRFVSKPFRPG